jgi:hypothetical protein
MKSEERPTLGYEIKISNQEENQMETNLTFHPPQKRMEVQISMPLANSANESDLEVSEQDLLLTHPKYKELKV